MAGQLYGLPSLSPENTYLQFFQIQKLNTSFPLSRFKEGPGGSGGPRKSKMYCGYFLNYFNQYIFNKNRVMCQVYRMHG